MSAGGLGLGRSRKYTDDRGRNDLDGNKTGPSTVDGRLIRKTKIRVG